MEHGLSRCDDEDQVAEGWLMVFQTLLIFGVATS